MKFIWKTFLPGSTGKKECNKQLNQILYCLSCAFFIVTLCGCQQNDAIKILATVDDMKIPIGEFKERFAKELNLSMAGELEVKSNDKNRPGPFTKSGNYAKSWK